jgi:hypothetical protein
MKFIGLDIFNSNVHFNGAVNLGTAFQGNETGYIVVTDEHGEVQRSNSINLKKDTLALGTGNTRSFTLTREISNTGNGSDLIIQGGDGKGTDKPGGDLLLYGGASTGNTEGGEIYFYNSNRSGSTSSTPNAHRTLMYTDSAQGELILSGLTAIRGVGENTLAFENDHDMKFVIDKDNDTGAGEHFLWLDYTTKLMRLKDNFILTVNQASNYKGLVFDGANHVIKAGDRATITSNDDATTGGVNTAGVDLTLGGGAGTGTGAGGTIKLGTFPAGGSSTTANSTYANIATFEEGGKLTLDSTDTTVGNSAELKFKKDAADTEDGEVLGQITFYGEDEGNNQTQFAGIKASISESDETDEAGKLEFQVAESDGTTTTMTTGLTLEGEHATDGQIDVTVAAGSASTTTVAGDLIVTSRLSLDSVAIAAVQTSAESFVDNSTSIMTSAAIQDKIQAHYSYQYISFTGNATTPADGDWMVPSGNGISNHLWNVNASNGSGGSSNGKTKGSSNITVTANSAGNGIVVPQACVLVGFEAFVRNSSRHANLGVDGDATEYLKDQRSCGLFVGQPNFNDYDATGDLTLRCYSAQLGQGTTGGGGDPDTDFYLRVTKATDMGNSISLSAGDMIVPAIAGTKSDGNHHSGGCIVSWTIVLKTLIP